MHGSTLFFRLRERVVATVAGGRSCRAVAELFDVSVASVVKWSQRARMTGSAAAKPMGGRRPYLLEGERDWLMGRLTEKPDLTLHALLAELAERGVVGVLRHALALPQARGDQLQKNTFFASEQTRPEIARRARLVAPASSEDRCGAARLHRRDLGQDQHGAAARLVAARGTAQGARAARSLAGR